MATLLYLIAVVVVVVEGVVLVVVEGAILRNVVILHAQTLMEIPVHATVCVVGILVLRVV
jgi:hypothetical protein